MGILVAMSLLGTIRGVSSLDLDRRDIIDDDDVKMMMVEYVVDVS